MKAATIGTGFITTWFIKSWLKYTGNTCHCIYSRSKEKGQTLANEFNVQTIYTDLNEMLNDPEVDVVYVASPNSLHYEHSLLALQAKKHVIVEKPFCSTLDEFEHLREVAIQNGCFLFEGITTCYLPNLDYIKNKLSSIGRVSMVQLNMSQYSSKYDAFRKQQHVNVFDPAFSGGALMDLGVYNLHLIIELFGKPQSIHYQANIKRGIDTSGVCTLVYPDFIVSSVACKDSRGPNFVSIQAEDGTITVNSSASLCKEVNYNNETYNAQEHELTHYYYVKLFTSAIENNNIEWMKQRLEHSYQVMQCLVEARRSAGIVFEADNERV